jgi:hypothetical protein
VRVAQKGGIKPGFVMSRRSEEQQRFAIALAPLAPLAPNPLQGAPSSPPGGPMLPQIWGKLNSVPPKIGGLGGLLSR